MHPVTKTHFFKNYTMYVFGTYATLIVPLQETEKVSCAIHYNDMDVDYLFETNNLSDTIDLITDDTFIFDKGNKPVTREQLNKYFYENKI